MSWLKKMTALILVASLGGSGCANWQWGKRETGAVIGAAAGAAIGAAGAKRKTQGALIGAAAGALAGGLIGWYLDKQQQEMERLASQINAQQAARQEDQSAIKAVRQEDQLVIIMPSNSLFDTNSAQLHPGAQNNLREVADILKRYPHSDVIISGHTDSSGDTAYNRRLSEDRAEAVKAFMMAQGVDPGRLITRGYGETMPVASNETTAGRQQNRRVELQIKPRAEELAKEYPSGPPA